MMKVVCYNCVIKTWTLCLQNPFIFIWKGICYFVTFLFWQPLNITLEYFICITISICKSSVFKSNIYFLLTLKVWGDNTEGQIFFHDNKPLWPLRWRRWKAHTDTLTQLAGFCQSSQGNQPQLFMLLLFIWPLTTQSLHFQLQHCQIGTLTVQWSLII